MAKKSLLQRIQQAPQSDIVEVVNSYLEGVKMEKLKQFFTSRDSSTKIESEENKKENHRILPAHRQN